MPTQERTNFAIDLTNLKVFARALKVAQPRLARELRSNLVDAGETVARRAKEIVSQWSVSIPPTISVRVSTIAVYVGAGSAPVPLAGLYEAGNAGGGHVRGSTGTFRHPVYGNPDVWKTQVGHPFLRPALTETEPVLIERVRFAVDATIRDLIRNS